MLNNFNKSVTMSAVSAVAGETGESVNVMYMNASISGGSLNINQSIQNAGMYELHSAEVDEDYEAFRNAALEFSKKYEAED